MEPLYRAHAGEEGSLPQPVHDAGGAPELCVRRRRSGDVSEAARTAAANRSNVASDESRATASPRPTTPASPRRPRRRRGTTVRRGCGSSTPTRRDSPLPGDGRSPSPGMQLGEENLRNKCCVRRRLPLDIFRRRVQAATAAAGCVGDGVKNLAGAPLQRAVDVSAKPDDDSRSNGEESPRGHEAEGRAGRRPALVDTSVVVLTETPADGGTVVGGGVGGGRKAARDVFLAQGIRRGKRMPRLKLAVELGAVYWFQELMDWVKGTPRDGIRDFWSWHGVLGSPIEQNDDTCAICGTLVCLEARHRSDFEKRHGFNTFPYYIPDETVEDLKNLCKERGVWNARYGANEMDVLQLIKSTGGCAAPGVPGWKPCRLSVKSWKYHKNSARQPMTQSELAGLIHTEGPILGDLLVDGSYYAQGWEHRVYRGPLKGRKGGSPHLVVCVAYCLQPIVQRHWHGRTELHIAVVDNHDEDGPVRWILASAFTGFVELHVEPLDATELRVTKPSLWHRLLHTVRRD